MYLDHNVLCDEAKGHGRYCAPRMLIIYRFIIIFISADFFVLLQYGIVSVIKICCIK